MLTLLDSTKQYFFCLFTYQNHPNSHSCHPPLKLSLAFFFFSPNPSYLSRISYSSWSILVVHILGFIWGSFHNSDTNTVLQNKVLKPSTIDILDWIVLCGGGCLVHCRFSSVPGLYLLGAST